MKTLKELYFEGKISTRIHTAIHETMHEIDDFKAYESVESMTMKELIETRKFGGGVLRKIMAMKELYN